MINRYLRERGDASIRPNADLIAKAAFYTDPNFPDLQDPHRSRGRERRVRRRLWTPEPPERRTRRPESDVRPWR